MGRLTSLNRSAAALMIASVLALTLSACSGSDEPASDGGQASEREPDGGEITENSGDKFVAEMRKNVPGAAAYGDRTILAMATNVCALGRVSLGVQVLDNYSQIEAVDRAEVARIALDTACPS